MMTEAAVGQPRPSLSPSFITSQPISYRSYLINIVQPNILRCMAPERPPPRISIISKPYTRDTFAISPSVQKCRTVALSRDSPTSEKKDSVGQSGFPTLAQYHAIEQGYIDALTPRRKGKALISQALFDRIWHVLHNNDTTRENAQFRFWVRKMFTLSKSYTLFGASRPLGREVVLHDGLLVAVREQIYELLCYYHGSAKHGGRDKTCACLRKHYTWVPKDLVAQFVKACPTCFLKRSGRTDGAVLPLYPGMLSDSPALPSDVREPKVKKECPSPTLPPLKSDTGDLDALLYPLPSTPITPHPQFALPLGQIQVNRPNRYTQFLLNSLNTPVDCSMTRVVPLNEEGLRRGWQHRNVNYRSAYGEYAEPQPVSSTMSYNSVLGRVHPDIPDVTLLFKPGFQDVINFKAEGTEDLLDGKTLATTILPLGDSAAQSTPPSLATSPTVGGGSPDMSIDPFLLELSLSMEHPSPGDVSPISRENVPLSRAQGKENHARTVSPSFTSLYFSPGPYNVNAAGAPSPPKFKAWGSVKTYRDFLAAAEDLNSGLLGFGNKVPGAKDNGQLWDSGNKVNENENGNSSPESSVRSDASELSLGPCMSGSGSPASINTPIIPVDGKVGIIDMLGLSDGGDGEGTGLGTAVQAVSFGGFEA